MGSREHWGAPPRRAGWDQHCDMPPHYNQFQVPHNYYNQPPPYHNDGKWHDERSYSSVPPINRPPARESFRGRGRGRGQGRGRGEHSMGRGQTYNSPKTTPWNDGGQKSNARNNNSLNSKPAWLSQPVNQNKTSTSNESVEIKPTWLTQSASQTNTSSNNSADSKPAWLTQVPSQEKANNTNVSGNMPAWLNVSSSKSNDTSSLSTMPAWLQSTSSTGTNTIRSQSPPPPPPPSYPPPRNQPNIQSMGAPSPAAQRFLTPMYETKTAKQANKAKKKELAEVKVAAPGEATFISFKNSLQEYSQKKGFPVPVYHTFKNSYGHSARVEANKTTFQSSGIQKDKKEAEQNAAYEALKALGLLAPTVPFSSSTKAGSKRTQPSPQSIAKKLKGDVPTSSSSPNYKCQLNEFCQKFHLPVPTYETVHETGGFVTTLVYNKKVYLSPSPQATKKAAEQNIAQFVLSKVNQAPPPLDQNQKLILQNFVAASAVANSESSTTGNATTPEPSKSEPILVSSVHDLAAKNVTPMISYKNKLQEVCQKRKIYLPTYETVKEGNAFQCKVTIDGKVFNATGCKTKKGAEQSAARVALQALGLLDE